MKHQVLLIDDVDDDREMYEFGLRSDGFDVLLARTADAAATAAIAQPPIIVLHLQDEDWTLCEELCQVCPGSPVVVLTAHVRPDRENRKRAQDTPNCAAFVGKPCTPPVLTSVIERVLSGERRIELSSGLHG